MNKMEPNLRKTYYSYSDHKTLREARAYFAWQYPGRKIVRARLAYPGKPSEGFIVEFL